MKTGISFTLEQDDFVRCLLMCNDELWFSGASTVFAGLLHSGRYHRVQAGLFFNLDPISSLETKMITNDVLRKAFVRH